SSPPSRPPLRLKWRLENGWGRTVVAAQNASNLHSAASPSPPGFVAWQRSSAHPAGPNPREEKQKKTPPNKFGRIRALRLLAFNTSRIAALQHQVKLYDSKVLVSICICSVCKAAKAGHQ